ncbi:MAG TPA: restriction endonuclease subunit S [Flavobacteriaceae bacterium]|nr:restriction endonuclease subunit S [Flavobacteriaceae bacterium]
MEENQVHIPDGWVLNELSNLIIEKRKSSLKVSDATNYGNFPFFTSGETILKHTDKQIDGQNIFLATGGVANIKYYDGEASYSTDTYAITSKNEIDTEYLYFDLLNILYYINANYFQGSGLKHLQKKDLKKHQILFPKSLTEQTQIATILSKVDEAITQTEQLIAKYTRIKTGLMQDLLTKGIDENGNIRSEETHEFKDSPLGRIPKEWECKLLGDNNIIELHNNKRKPISSKERGHMIGDFPYYGATGIIDMLNEFRVDGEFVLFGEDGDHFLKWVYQEQTILTNGKFNVSNHAHIVKGTAKCSTKWIHYFFCHRDITFYLTRQGAGRFKLNKTSLFSLPILLPRSKNEQNAIISRIEKVNEYSDNLDIHLNKLQSLKTGLMQDLLSGKVRVKHLIKETASV